MDLYDWNSMPAEQLNPSIVRRAVHTETMTIARLLIAKDAVVPAKDVQGLVEKLKTQKGIVIDQKIIPGANHFFAHEMDELMKAVDDYLDFRLDPSCPIR